MAGIFIQERRNTGIPVDVPWFCLVIVGFAPPIFQNCDLLSLNDSRKIKKFTELRVGRNRSLILAVYEPTSEVFFSGRPQNLLFYS